MTTQFKPDRALQEYTYKIVTMLRDHGYPVLSVGPNEDEAEDGRCWTMIVDMINTNPTDNPKLPTKRLRLWIQIDQRSKARKYGCFFTAERFTTGQRLRASTTYHDSDILKDLPKDLWTRRNIASLVVDTLKMKDQGDVFDLRRIMLEIQIEEQHEEIECAQQQLVVLNKKLAKHKEAKAQA